MTAGTIHPVSIIKEKIIGIQDVRKIILEIGRKTPPNLLI